MGCRKVIPKALVMKGKCMEVAQSLFDMLDDLKECKDTLWLTDIETVADRVINILISNGFEEQLKKRYTELGL